MSNSRGFGRVLYAPPTDEGVTWLVAHSYPFLPIFTYPFGNYLAVPFGNRLAVGQWRGK